MLALQEARQPKKVKPPYRINEQFADGKGPGLAEGKKNRPPCALRGCFAIALNVIEFRPRHARMLFWPAVDCEPKNEPQKYQSADTDKCASPLPDCHNGRNNQGR